MSKNWVKDIAQMHEKYGVNAKVNEFDNEKLKEFARFRINFLEEELNELKTARTAEDENVQTL